MTFVNVSDGMKVSELFRGPKVEVATGSGMLRVSIGPRVQGLGAILALAADIFFAWFVHRQWSHLDWMFRAIFVWIFVSSIPLFVYQLLGEEVIEIDSQNLTIRKGIHGWERKREYAIENCSELEWKHGGKGHETGLRCKIGWRPILMGSGLTEDNAIEIFAALQQVLPDVAQRICIGPGGKEHFLTLGLSK